MRTEKKRPATQRNRGTKGQRQVAPKLSRARRKKGDDIFGFMAGQFEIVGDIVLPIEDWTYSDPAKDLEE
jgi:hypothetical protein